MSLAVISYHTSPLANPGSGDAGGMNVYVRALSGALARAGVRCDIYTRATSVAEAPVVVAEPGVRVFRIEAGPVALVERDDLPEYLPVFVRRVGETAVLCQRQYDVVHGHYWLSGEAGRHLAREWEVPFVQTFHTLGRVRNQRLAPGEESEPDERLDGEDRVVEAATRLLASTRQEGRDLVTLYGASPRCLEVIRPGVDHRLFRPSGVPAARARRRLGLGWRRTVLAAGRLQPLKGFDVAIRALRLLPADVQLVIVGGPSGPSGPRAAHELRELASSLGLSRRVKFFDPVAHEDLAEWYAASDVVVVPSRSESFGLVALEAQACGVPVVASDVGGLQDAVGHGIGGLRVPPGDSEALASALDLALFDPACNEGLRRGAIEWSRDFVWSATAAHLRGLYAELADVAARRGCGESVSA
jgi:D-inositol-3-phosphate glycosyltransferase